MKCCDEHCAGHGCNQGCDCPKRAGAVSHWAPMEPGAGGPARHEAGNFWLPDPVDHVEHLTFVEVALVFFCLLVCIAAIVATVGTFAGFSWARWLA
jgi:hypothetical protein